MGAVSRKETENWKALKQLKININRSCPEETVRYVIKSPYRIIRFLKTPHSSKKEHFGHRVEK